MSKDWIIVGDLGYDQVALVAFPHATGGMKALYFDEDAAIAIRDNFISARALNTGRWEATKAGHVNPPLKGTVMPTLRDDINDMINRMKPVHDELVKKFAHGTEWTRGEHIQCLDAFESAIELGQEALPFIPSNVVRGAGGSVVGPVGPVDTHDGPPILRPTSRGTADGLYKCWYHVVTESGYKMHGCVNVHHIEEKDGFFFVVGEGGKPWVIYHAEQVLGYWLDPGNTNQPNANTNWRIIWKEGGPSASDTLICSDVSLVAGRWALHKVIGNGDEASEQIYGYLRPGYISSIVRE